MTEPQTLHPGDSGLSRQHERFFRDIEIEFLIHELKDPIAVIETGLRTLLERQEKIGPLTERQEKTLKRTLRSSRKARQMLNSLLEVGRSEAGCFFYCGFSPAATIYKALADAMETVPGPNADEVPGGDGEEELAGALADWNIHVDISPEAAKAEIYQDETKFRQIVGNLLKNALHHRRRSIRVRLGLDAGAGALVVEVSDDGPGIRSEHSRMIFERYTRVADNSGFRARGHGLGLAGARIIARCLGGDVEIVNGGGEGATFQVRIPVTAEACREPETGGK